MYQTARLLKLLTVTSGLIVTVGCAMPPHNNTLVFAVSRKIGMDISPSGASTGLTVGFSSSEFAFVPLWANGGDGKPMAECGKLPKEGCAVKPKFSGLDQEGNSRSQKDEDAYSVFASFGGAVGGGSENGQPSAKLAVASFFATGIAAQNLAEKSEGSILVGLNDDAKGASKRSPTRRGVLAFLDDTGVNKDSVELVSDACVVKLQAQYGSSDKTLLFAPAKGMRPDGASQLIWDLVKDREPNGLKKLDADAKLLRAKFKDAEQQENEKKAASTANYGSKVPTEEAIKAICT